MSTIVFSTIGLGSKQLDLDSDVTSATGHRRAPVDHRDYGLLATFFEDRNKVLPDLRCFRVILHFTIIIVIISIYSEAWLFTTFVMKRIHAWKFDNYS